MPPTQAAAAQVQAELAREELRRLGHHQQPVADGDEADGRRDHDHPGERVAVPALQGDDPPLVEDDRRRRRGRATRPMSSATFARAVDSHPFALVAENGGPRFVAYQGRKTARTSSSPARTPTAGAPRRPGSGRRRAVPRRGDGRGVDTAATVPPWSARVPVLVSRAVSRRPDFFILGAPKCGTTALSEYLRRHERIFVSTPKEPHYFCDDFDYYYAPGQRTEEHYLRLFEEAGDAHLAVGEASVWYLYSHTAARRIMEFDPAARVIVMVRNPVELVPSLHSQLRYMLDEVEPDPARAWELQAARARGEGLPATVRVPEFLQYGEAARLGAQVRRVLDTVPREQVKVLVFDDLRADTGDGLPRRARHSSACPTTGAASSPGSTRTRSTGPPRWRASPSGRPRPS